MIYEDMMYGTDGIMPGATATPDQEAEIATDSSTSIILHHWLVWLQWVWRAWCIHSVCHGNSQIRGHSRVIRSSSPFGLYSSGVDMLTGLPNEYPLVDIPLKSQASSSPEWPPGLEQHGPYQHGGIFHAINGGGHLIPDPPVVVGVQLRTIGPSQPGYAKTETVVTM